MSRRGGCAERVAPSLPCFSPRTRLLLEPFRDISSPTTPTIHFCQNTPRHTASMRRISRHGKISPRDSSLRSLCNRSHRAHVRLCSASVSKNRLRLSCEKQYRAAGFIGRTRKTCPKKRSKETTSVAFSNSPCKSRLISLPIADMAFANIQILRQYHHYPCKFESTPIVSLPLSIRYGTSVNARLESRGTAKEYSGRPGLVVHPASA